MAKRAIKTKVKKPAVDAKFIHIRNMSLETRQMLYQLKVVFGKKQNPLNLVRAGHGYLELLREKKDLEKEIEQLNERLGKEQDNVEQALGRAQEVLSLMEDFGSELQEKRKSLSKMIKARKGRGVGDYPMREE